MGVILIGLISMIICGITGAKASVFWLNLKVPTIIAVITIVALVFLALSYGIPAP